MRAVAVFALILAVTGPPAPGGTARVARATAMPFELGEEGGVIVPVTLNGGGPFRFLLDTGSTHSAVSPAAAAAARAPAVARAVVASAVGEQSRIVVRIGHVECGPLVLTDLLPSVVDLRGVDPAGRLDGVIGQDALARLRYTIDFRGRRLVWWPEAGAIASGSAIVLEPSQGRFLALLPQPTSVLRLVPDSGAGTLVLFEASLPRLPLVTLLSQTATLTAMTASGSVRLATLAELQVGSATLRHVPAVVLAGRRTAEPIEGDGLLPLHLFSRVTFDGPGRMLIVD